MERTRVVCVADDRTGAADAGDRFAERGFETVLGDGGDAAVVVVDTDSRYAARDAAAKRVTAALDSYPRALVYKKIDSTLRGNVAAETAAALRASGSDLALVAPAFPAAGRITVGGVHLVEGTPVAESTAGADPEKPAPASALPEVFADAGVVAHLGLETVARGADAVRDFLRAVPEEGERESIVVCDAARDAHLDSLAAGAAALDATVCYVGSAGLAGHVRVGPSTPALGAVGSVAAESLAGLDVLGEAVVELDAPALFGAADPVTDAATRAVARLDAGENAVITAARARADVGETIEAGRAAGHGESEIRAAVTDALARAVRETADRATPGGLFLSGGETATAVLDALDASGVGLTGRPVEDGVPLGTVRGGALGGTPVVTKAGAFGDRETILTCLRALSRYDGR